jgi:hypothetical protein
MLTNVSRMNPGRNLKTNFSNNPNSYYLWRGVNMHSSPNIPGQRVPKKKDGPDIQHTHKDMLGLYKQYMETAKGSL